MTMLTFAPQMPHKNMENSIFSESQENACYSEAYSEQCQTYKMEHFGKIVEGFEGSTIFAKRSILDVWQGS